MLHLHKAKSLFIDKNILTSFSVQEIKTSWRRTILFAVSDVTTFGNIKIFPIIIYNYKAEKEETHCLLDYFESSAEISFGIFLKVKDLL